MRQKKIWLVTNAGYIAIIAAFLGSVSDVLLLYSPNGGFLNPDFQFLNDISYTRLLSGSLLGVFCIPFEILGSWQIYEVVKKNNPALAMVTFMMAIYFACIGVTVHILYGIIGVGMHFHAALPLEYVNLIDAHFEQMNSFMQPAAAIVVLLHIINTILFVILIRGRNDIFSKSLTYINPISLYVVLVSPYFWWPAVGYILAPAAFNLCYGIFFGITSYYIAKNKKADLY